MCVSLKKMEQNIYIYVRVCVCMYIEGFQLEWCISIMIYSREIPFLSETLDMYNISVYVMRSHERYTSVFWTF